MGDVTASATHFHDSETWSGTSGPEDLLPEYRELVLCEAQ